jgi:hypothetical protein
MADLDGLRQRVQQVLLDHDLKIELRKSAVLVPFESTSVMVSFGEIGNDRTVVSLRGLVCQEVPISADLKAFIADKSAEYLFGHLAYLEIEGTAYIEFRHNLLGDFLDPDEIMVALSAVAQTSNELDDVIKERFGGERWIDPHPSSG